MTTSSICVDASLILRLVLDISDEQLPGQWGEWEAAGFQLFAPSLLYYEVSNALFQYQKQRILNETTIEQALLASLALPIQLHTDTGLHIRALRLATRFSLPATYDAHYLALAEYLGAEFWSADQKLIHAVQSELPWVHLYS